MIRHFSYRLVNDSYYYINLVIEPLDNDYKLWYEAQSEEYQLLNIIRKDNLKEYERELHSIDITTSPIDFKSLDKYYISGYQYQNNILQRLKSPFTNIYRYCEVFEKNAIVEACINKLKDIQETGDNQHEMVSILSTLNFWWY